MGVQVVTADDLIRFKEELLEGIEKLFERFHQQSPPTITNGLKTREVLKILGCSNGKLQLLRAKGKIHCKKVGGTLYYSHEDVRKLVLEGF